MDKILIFEEFDNSTDETIELFSIHLNCELNSEILCNYINDLLYDKSEFIKFNYDFNSKWLYIFTKSELDKILKSDKYILGSNDHGLYPCSGIIARIKDNNHISLKNIQKDVDVLIGKTLILEKEDEYDSINVICSINIDDNIDKTILLAYINDCLDNSVGHLLLPTRKGQEPYEFTLDELYRILRHDKYVLASKENKYLSQLFIYGRISDNPDDMKIGKSLKEINQDYMTAQF